MANLLSEATKQQGIALGQLGWTLRRIQAATGVRRETAGAYLKAAGLGGPAGRAVGPPAKTGHSCGDEVVPASWITMAESAPSRRARARDDEMVAASLGERYGGGGTESGRAFLEKIVQVPLHLPRPISWRSVGSRSRASKRHFRA